LPATLARGLLEGCSATRWARCSAQSHFRERWRTCSSATRSGERSKMSCVDLQSGGLCHAETFPKGTAAISNFQPNDAQSDRGRSPDQSHGHVQRFGHACRRGYRHTEGTRQLIQQRWKVTKKPQIKGGEGENSPSLFFL
jgi:hypothetical protein